MQQAVSYLQTSGQSDLPLTLARLRETLPGGEDPVEAGVNPHPAGKW